jgi:hypothetical protein
MKFKELLRRWWLGKFQINITYITEGVKSTKVPTVESEVVHKSRKSNLRFCMYEVQKPGDTLKTYYYTDAYINGKWQRVEGTWFSDKNAAMEVHKGVLEGKTFEEMTRSTVLWEGLDKDETETWIGVQKNAA